MELRIDDLGVAVVRGVSIEVSLLLEVGFPLFGSEGQLAKRIDPSDAMDRETLFTIQRRLGNRRPAKDPRKGFVELELKPLLGVGSKASVG